MSERTCSMVKRLEAQLADEPRDKLLRIIADQQARLDAALKERDEWRQHYEIQSEKQLKPLVAKVQIEHEKFLKANERANAAESRLEECLDLIADAVANHEGGGSCDMDLARASVVLARNESAVEKHVPPKGELHIIAPPSE